MNQRILFFSYCFLAFVISYIPFVGLPFIYLATIFHEISHALMAVLTGGRVIEFVLEVNGSGHVLSQGGSRFLIAISGYLGVSIWAALLFQVGRHKQLTRITITTLIVLFSVTLILWVNSLMTVFILGAVIALLVIILSKTSDIWIAHLCRFIAILVLFNAIKSPLYLIDGRNIGDGALLAEITWLPEIFWVLLWCVCGLGVLISLYRNVDRTA